VRYVSKYNELWFIGSQISNSVLEINQSGRDTISKETAKKLEQLVNNVDRVVGCCVHIFSLHVPLKILDLALNELV
jgi:hypothetical protein